MPATDFHPGGWLGNPHVQSILASSGIRRLALKSSIDAFLARSVPHWLPLSPSLTLQGFWTRPERPARGLVMLLHGWEGSAQSTYLLSLGARLLADGYAVFRLNFRDHGDTQHLNPGIFHSCRIDEVVSALGFVAAHFAERPLAIGGFSLGGNFALRVALRAAARSIPLDYVFAVCPAIHPPHVLTAIERAPNFYQAYFMHKWRRSLRRKQTAFPDQYDFAWARGRNMRELTRGLVERHTDFNTLDDYLNAYSIAGEVLADLAVPGAILAAGDDPICPVADFQQIKLPATVELCITEQGGHCGFIRDLGLSSFAEDFLLQRLRALSHGARSVLVPTVAVAVAVAP
ncbi:MAG: alpha/beta hydrolase [Lysobacterales bacterium CG02_land_8_20_14_3_00_62_12]|nr:MAG: alpha/beta hydrolase [Xanthomonadales bacterium CG02_land_8_20_14_3_00_62_12]